MQIKTNIRVLIVDDLETSRKTFRLSLKALNYTDTIEAINGEDALTKLKEDSRIRLILLDWNMPKMSGMDFYREFRKLPEAEYIKVIMITAESLQANVITAIQAGVNQYMLKPVMPKTLEEKIVSITDKDIANLKKDLLNSEALIQKNEALDETSRIAQLRAMYLSTMPEIQSVCEIYPWKADYHFTAGELYQKVGYSVQAVSSLEKAIKVDPKHESAGLKLARLFLQRNQGTRAIKLLTNMSIVKPTSQIYQLLGEAFLIEGNTNKSIKAFNDAIRLGELSKSSTKRQHAEMQNGLGGAFNQKHQETNDQAWREKSVQSLQKAIEYDPTLISAHFNLISVYKQAGHLEKANALIKKTAEITPDDTDGWISLGKMYLENKEKPKSSFAFKRAVETSTNPSQAFFDIGEIYDAFDSESARKYFVRADKISPNQFHILNKLGLICRKLDNINDAINYYQEALKVENEDEKLHFNLACAYLKGKLNDSREKARFHLAKAIRILPEFEEATDLLEKLS